MAEIYFVRHGQSEANAANLVAGWRDYPLTEEGVNQATKESQKIKRKFHIGGMISSPLMRAHDTAKIIAQGNNFPVEDIVLLDGLKEKGYGELEGRISPEELRGVSDENIVRAGGETFDVFAERVEQVNQQILYHLAQVGISSSLLIVGHAGFYRMAQCVSKGLPPSEMVNMEKPNNSISLRYPIGKNWG